MTDPQREDSSGFSRSEDVNRPLDDADFLTRSDNRVLILEVLAEQPRDVADLLEATGVARVTLNRLLAELEKKGWVTSVGSTYRIMPFGRIVNEDVSTLLETIATSQTMHDIQQYLPTEEMDFDLRRLNDARIARPSPSNTVAPLNRLAELYQAVDERLWVFVSAFDMVAARAAVETLQEKQYAFDCILTSSVVETVANNQEMTNACIELIEGGAELYRFNGEDPLYSINVYDETVALELNDGAGGIPAVIDTDDEQVLTWAEETFETYRSGSILLDATAFES